MRMRGEQPWKRQRARSLRSSQTPAEDTFWRAVKAKRLGRFKLVRQVPIGPYFADFVCRSHKLIVEIDGGTHSSPEELADDERRTLHLQQLGYRIVRVSNADVVDNLDAICRQLIAVLEGGR